MNVTVKPGYHVITPKKTFQPGESLELEDKEAKRLFDAGIVSSGKGEGSEGGQPLNVTQTVELVKVADAEALQQLLATENALASPRKGVLDAITKRQTELSAPAE